MVFLLLGVIIAIATWLNIRLVKKFGLGCPTCGCNLADKARRGKALVTGNCSKCGKKVFEEESFSPASGPIDREEFKTKLADWSRRTNREMIRYIILLFVAMAVGIPMTKYFQRLVDNGGLDWVTVTQWRWFAGLMLGTVCLAAVGIFILAFRGKFKMARPMPCPECGRSLAGMAGKFAAESGMCLYCGCRLFEQPPSEKAS